MRFLADENLDYDIVRGVMRRRPSTDIVRAQDVDLCGVDDRTVLEWAARERRVVLSHDARTMPRYAFARADAGESMPGLVIVPQRTGIAQCIDDIVLIAECSVDGEWDGRVIFLPL